MTGGPRCLWRLDDDRTAGVVLAFGLLGVLVGAVLTLPAGTVVTGGTVGGAVGLGFGGVLDVQRRQGRLPAGEA